MKETLKRLWLANRLTVAQLEKAVRLGWITEADAAEIRGISEDDGA
jgi:hypothetical protein